jgi:hypothetical protein
LLALFWPLGQVVVVVLVIVLVVWCTRWYGRHRRLGRLRLDWWHRWRRRRETFTRR